MVYKRKLFKNIYIFCVINGSSLVYIFVFNVTCFFFPEGKCDMFIIIQCIKISYLHLFACCPFAKQVWQEVGLLDFIEAKKNHAKSFREFFFSVLTSAISMIVGFLSFCGGIWRERNEKVLEELCSLLLVQLMVQLRCFVIG